MTIKTVYNCDKCNVEIEARDVVDIEITFGSDYQIRKQFCRMEHAREWIASLPDNL